MTPNCKSLPSIYGKQDGGEEKRGEERRREEGREEGKEKKENGLLIPIRVVMFISGILGEKLKLRIFDV